jgi:hypothetical protein
MNRMVKLKLLARFLPIFLIVEYTAVAFGQTEVLKRHGWKILADTGHSELIIEYEPLGTVLRQVRLHVKQGNEWQELVNWQVTIDEHALLIRTEDPETEWTIYCNNRRLGIGTSVAEGQVTGLAPANNHRFPARMIDYSGGATSVAWRGTREVVYSYGGIQTVNQSFLPAANPEVLYLSLGEVCSRNMHCLFDRDRDIMIKFHERTEMLPGKVDHLLQVSIPAGGPDMEALVMYPEYYTDHLGLPVYEPMDDGGFEYPPVLWNSWTNYYYMVTEEEVMRNVDWIVDHFKDYGLTYIVIDDGPERGPRGEHYWISNWNKETFPSGGKGLADQIRSKGLVPGLWLVPNAYAGALEEHPEWYLQDKDGKHIMVYNTPSLDYTHPEVLGFLEKLFSTLRDWGYAYFKFDGEFALTEYIPFVDRDKLYDKNISPVKAYRNRLEVIRNAVGDGTFLEGCPGGTPLQGTGYFNSYFNGDDIYNSWLGMYPFFLSINANLFLNHIACYLMPGEGICVSPKMQIDMARNLYNPEFIRVASSREGDIASVGTTMSEARTIVTFAAMSGTPYSFADRLPDLPAERIELLKKSLPALPIVPMDLFSRGGYSSWGLFKEFSPQTYAHNFPRMLDLKINAASGRYDVVAVTNWKDEPESREISFEDKLGLYPGQSYLVFDFWHQDFLGIFKHSLEVDVEPHDTRVLIVRPLLNRPQVLATDRHISGAYSIEELEWDGVKKTLTGSSKTIPGTGYSLFLHVPDEYDVLKIRSGAKTVSEQVGGNVFKLTLLSDKKMTSWSIQYKD